VAETAYYIKTANTSAVKAARTHRHRHATLEWLTQLWVIEEERESGKKWG
jgi:hypothetical protein